MNSHQPTNTAARIALTGIGLTTVVGQTAPSTVTAIRAGIMRFTHSKSVNVPTDLQATEFEGAAVAHVKLDPPPPQGQEHLTALLTPAIKECLQDAALTDEALRQADWRIHYRAADGQQGHQVNALSQHIPQLPPTAQEMPITGQGLCHGALFASICQAAAALRSGQHAVAVIACADSLSTSPLLKHLNDSERLKAGNRAEGLIAGEAGSALILETEARARARGATVYAYLTASGQAHEPNAATPDSPTRAEGLTQAFQQALETLGEHKADLGLIVTDLNGERQAALEWALTQPRIFPAPKQPLRLWRPIKNVGDCGAATDSILIAVAAYALAKGYARCQHVALMASDDTGPRHVLCLESADSLPRYGIKCPEPLVRNKET